MKATSSFSLRSVVGFFFALLVYLAPNHCFLCGSISLSSAASSPISTASFSSMWKNPTKMMMKPIVYTIAGSDSGGGAGIQADLHAIHSMGCHGCSAITCLTAQNSMGVDGVHAPPVSFLRQQLETLLKDLPPHAIKIGMLGTKEMAIQVGDFLQTLQEKCNDINYNFVMPFVVLDPVMISTSGHKLIDDDAQQAIIDHVFPHADILTPNKFEAEALLGRKLNTPQEVEKGAKELLNMGVKSVLLKGGHMFLDVNVGNVTHPDVNATHGYAQDYFLSKQDETSPAGEPRLCDGARGIWLRTNRYDTIHTHGTGCTLSSVIASALALGRVEQAMEHGTGAGRSIGPVDACCLAKAYVTAGIGCGVQLGQGPGPVAHTGFPSSHLHYPSLARDPNKIAQPCLPMKPADCAGDDKDTSRTATIQMGSILPIVGSVEWVERLAKCKGITDIQLRIKGEDDAAKIQSIVQKCQDICSSAGVRLWINDNWQAAVASKCFGVHLGQEDLVKCMEQGGLEAMQRDNIALGISTHSYGELSAALGIRPSYISMGPVFGTMSKKVAFAPQGLETVKKWRELIPPDVPFIAIGGIGDADVAKQVKKAGADCVSVIGAITGAEDTAAAVDDLIKAMS